MIFERISVGHMANFAYLFADEQTREGILIDPAFDHEKLLRQINKHNINLQYIILTHHHSDHVNASAKIKARTGALVCCHSETTNLLQGAAAHDKTINDGDQLKLGNKYISCIHTPGHAPGSICLIVDNKWLVTGDTLFIGDCGRADLQGGDIKELYASMLKLKQLPDHLIVCCGHNYGSMVERTLGEEKQKNPCLTAESLEQFSGI
jgi:glyoxylase-like metal-dependent hydrolase (beta-lactamase superfamily II)